MTACDRADLIQAVRALADWLESHPEIEFPWSLRDVLNPTDKAGLVQMAQAGGTVLKAVDEAHFHVSRNFGPIVLRFYAPRDQVCRKVVVGTEEVPEETKPAHTREIVEWVCDEPLLASEVSA